MKYATTIFLLLVLLTATGRAFNEDFGNASDSLLGGDRALAKAEAFSSSTIDAAIDIQSARFGINDSRGSTVSTAGDSAAPGAANGETDGANARFLRKLWIAALAVGGAGLLLCAAGAIPYLRAYRRRSHKILVLMNPASDTAARNAAKAASRGPVKERRVA